ncbi:MAG: RIP metalloprotease [Clostridiales bacterium]|nr:RIP metalloprotease [Clostridiales bacterium]
MDFTFILNCILALVILMILVLVHELGHYIAGRLLGFTITEFSIGMGPKIFKWKRKGILYSLRALPIGGSCMFYGEDPAGGGVEKVLAEGAEEVVADAPPETEAASEGEVVDEPRKVNFNDMPRWRRAIVLFAGPFMNFVVAFAIAIVMFTVFGQPIMTKPYATEIVAGGAADLAGMEVGDYILSVNGNPIGVYEDLKPALNAATDGRASVVVERDGVQVLLLLENMYDAERSGNFMNVSLDGTYEREYYGFFETIGKAFAYIWTMIGAMFEFLRMLFTGGLRAGDVAGPAGTIGLIAEYIPQGMETILNLGILLSVNLGFINLLPIPALDGSRLLFIGIHAVTGKRVPQKVEGVIHAVGLLLLFGLMIFLTFTDITACFGRMGAP